MTVTAQLADGRTLEFPDGTDPAVVQATVKKVIGNKASSPGDGENKTPAQAHEPDIAEKIAAHPLTRFATAAASPFLAVGEMLPGSAGEFFRDKVSTLRGMEKAGQQDQSFLEKHLGTGAEIAGNIMSPAALRVMQAMPYAVGATGLSRLPQLGKNIVAGAAGAGTMGALTPTGNVDDYGDTKQKQIVEAALIGGAFPVGAEMARGAGSLANNIFGPFRESWRTDAGRQWLSDKLGTGKRDVIDAIMQRQSIARGSPVSTADAIAAANMGKTNKFGSPLVALEDALEVLPGGPSDIAKSFSAKQKAALENEIGRIAGSNKRMNAALSLRDKITSPMRQTELGAAGEADRVIDRLAPTVEQKRQSLVSALQNQGQLSTESVQAGARNIAGKPGWISNADRSIEYAEGADIFSNIAKQRSAEKMFSENTLNSLREYGLKPLNADSIVVNINKKLATPGDRAVSLNEQVLSAVRDKITWIQEKFGRVTPEDLYAIRKTEINNVIENLTKDSTNATKQHAKSLVADVRNSIDDAIEAAGGDGWRKYLKAYQGLSRPINEMEVGRDLRAALTSPLGTERAASFGGAVRKAEEKILPETGRPAIEQLGSESRKAVARVTKELQRDTERKALGRNVALKDIFDIAESSKGSVKLPQLWSRPTSIARWLMHMTGNDADMKIARDLYANMKTNPDAFVSKYLKDVPPSQVPIVLQTLEKAAISGTAQQTAQQ